jgi:methylmalonyl-CoA mutase
MTDTLSLAADFPAATREMWLKLVEGVLKGASVEKLASKSADGLRIEPIYPSAHHVQPVIGRAPSAPWQIMQRMDHPDAAATNAQALHDLENGATGLTLVFADAHDAAGFGLPPTREAIDTALANVLLDAGIGFELQSGARSCQIATEFAGYIIQSGFKPADCDIRFGIDPIGSAAASGSTAADWAQLAPSFTDAITKLTAMGFNAPFGVADGRIVHNAGGSEAQELAFTLASLVHYLRALEAAGIPLETAPGMLYARMAADADQFMTMAKFRALRVLWARVEESCALKSQPLFIAAETSWRMLTQRDSDVNMLRATMAVFSAGLAGANSVTVLPHTLALGLPDAFARRVARNTQLILLEESNLAKVSDPAAGAGGIEALTQQLCQAAWTQFQEIEKAGGIFGALKQNLIQAKIATVRAARDNDIARRKNILTGASEFPNLHETAPPVIRPAVPSVAADAQAVAFNALTPIRLAEPFEALRDRSDAILKQSGARPSILLANLGKPSDFTARATFAKSLFEAGGIEAIDTDGFSDPAALAAAFKKSGAPLACLCSSDTVYAEQAIAAAQALHAAGAKHIYLAGRPGDHEVELRAAGIGEFIFAGGNALGTLETAYANMVTP